MGGAVKTLSGLENYLTKDATSVGRDLEEYVALLKKWQTVQNLVSRETLSELWPRHVADSLQLLRHITGKETLVMDVGSGGGFPAIPLAIATKSSPMRFILVESNKRKASFLRTISRQLMLDVKVYGQRLEDLSIADTGKIDLIVSRATAPLIRLFELVSPLWGPDTRGLFHKGRECGEELTKAGSDWAFDVIRLPSTTDDFGEIVDVRKLRPRTIEATTTI